MLVITIPAVEMFDEKTQTFFETKETVLELEHSLISISKWESKWHKPFLSKQEKTIDETIDYIKCMTITRNVDPNAYKYLTNSNIEQINNYIDDPMTATTFYDDSNNGGQKETITSELIYYWMIANTVPMECQKWHLNRLLTLLRVCSVKNTPPKKMGKRELANKYASLNAARKKQFNTKG